MKHSKEEDARLADEALRRAYADPSSFKIEGTKDARPAYLPEDLDEYAWLLEGKYIFRAVVYVVVAAILVGGWFGVSAFLAWYQEQQKYYEQNPQKCNEGGPTSYFCAERERWKNPVK